MAKPQENQPDTEAQNEETVAQPETLDPAQALAEIQAAFDAERAEMKDRLLRTLADLENTRKRAEKDRREAAMYGGTKLARDLLPVFDNLNRALDLIDDETRTRAQGMVEGLDLTLRELTNIFAKHGIERISPQTGDVFDPHLHEAMFEAPVPGTRAGQIIQIVAEGFRLHDHLLRPAKVGVSSTPAS